MILLLTEPYAPEAVLASDAVIAKGAVRAILQILAVQAVIAVIDIYALKAKFAVFAIITIHAIAGIQHNAAIKAVFIEIRRKQEVAIFIFVRMGAIIGIFRTDINIV